MVVGAAGGVEDQVSPRVGDIDCARDPVVPHECSGGGLRACAGVAEDAVTVEFDASGPQGEGSVSLQRSGKVIETCVGVGAGEIDGIFHKLGLPRLDEIPPVSAGVLQITFPGGARCVGRHQPCLRPSDRTQSHPCLNLGRCPGRIPNPNIPHRSLIERLVGPVRFAKVTARPGHARRHAGGRRRAHLHSVHIKTHRSTAFQNTGNMGPAVQRDRGTGGNGVLGAVRAQHPKRRSRRPRRVADRHTQILGGTVSNAGTGGEVEKPGIVRKAAGIHPTLDRQISPNDHRRRNLVPALRHERGVLSDPEGGGSGDGFAERQGLARAHRPVVLDVLHVAILCEVVVVAAHIIRGRLSSGTHRVGRGQTKRWTRDSANGHTGLNFRLRSRHIPDSHIRDPTVPKGVTRPVTLPDKAAEPGLVADGDSCLIVAGDQNTVDVELQVPIGLHHPGHVSPSAGRDGVRSDRVGFCGPGRAAVHTQDDFSACALLRQKNVVRSRTVADVHNPGPISVGVNVDPGLHCNISSQLGSRNHRDVKEAAVKQSSVHLTLIEEELPIRQTRSGNRQNPGG